MSFVVQVESANRNLRTVFIEGDRASIGRDESCDLPLVGSDVSRIHAEFRKEGDVIFVRDRSTNGTLAAGTLLRGTEATVPAGSPIHVGSYVLVVGAHAKTEGVVASSSSPPRLLSPVNAAEPAKPAKPAEPAKPAKPATAARTHAAEMKPPPKPKQAARPPRSAPASAPASQPQATPRSPQSSAATENVRLRREIHRQLLSEMDLAGMDLAKFDDPSLRPKVVSALRRIVEQREDALAPPLTPEVLVAELTAEALGLGPLEDMLDDPTVSEIMVVDPNTIYVERNGKIELTGARFTDDERARAAIERIVTPLGRRIDESSPLVDARLKDGSRVNAVIKPIALRGACITIRKFAKDPLTMDNLLDFGALSPEMARFLARSVLARKNIVISGGTGSGKTTLLNVLSAGIPEGERIVTIEDAAELQLGQPHVVSLETRPTNLEGKGAYTIRDLLKNAMRMRPDRIIVGECRGGEALDMLQAMNTGHDGSLTTTHANSPIEAISRLETLVLTSGVDLPIPAVRRQIASSIDLIVQQSRFSDGSRRVTSVTEIVGLDDDGNVAVVPIFEFVRVGTGPQGKVLGEYRATGYVPSYLNELIIKGLAHAEEGYL